MEKEFVSYEIALELKQLGFDEPCIAFYNGRFLDFKIWNDDGCESSQINVNMDVGQCPNAPTFSQVFRWFREKYGVYARPDKFDVDKWWVDWGDWNSSIYGTYEEAEHEWLLKMIEIAKN